MNGCLIGFAAIGIVAVVVSAVLAGFAIWAMRQHAAYQAGAQMVRGEDEYPALNEVWSTGPLESEAVAVRIPLRGMIALGGTSWRTQEDGASDIALLAIRRATLTQNVKAILLEVDSGGGGITASDILYNALLAFKASSPDRVIVVLMGDLAASGAYYVSLPADCIIAHPTTITGSIGVMMSSLNVAELAQKIGVRDLSITSGENKAILNPFTDPSPEQQKILQEIVDQMHTRFVTLFATHRNLPFDDARAIADGRIYLADQALALKMIDTIGYADDADHAVRALLGRDDIRFIRYTQNVSFLSLLRSPSFWGRVLSSAIPSAEQHQAPLLLK
ncbi:MAG: signal peptide peptidase SppA [Kiritimatiellaeota bacterium]|nr:signal peptide peptidase SppA [Kiritimatiellota bacterium]